jgi:hypothetical protein
MKTIIAISGAVMLVAAGCSTSRDYYGASDEFFETPSWGTAGSVSSGSSSSTDAANSSLYHGGTQHQDMQHEDMQDNSLNNSDQNMESDQPNLESHQ